jgi:hypothetical protein
MFHVCKILEMEVNRKKTGITDDENMPQGSGNQHPKLITSVEFVFKDMYFWDQSHSDRMDLMRTFGYCAFWDAETLGVFL